LKRLIALGIIVLSISTLAMAENSQPYDPTAKAYSMKVGEYKVIIVTPLDAKRSVLIGVQEKGQKEPDSYLAEGVVALAVSRLAKIAGRVDSSKEATKYAKSMIEARELALSME